MSSKAERKRALADKDAFAKVAVTVIRSIWAEVIAEREENERLRAKIEELEQTREKIKCEGCDVYSVYHERDADGMGWCVECAPQERV